MEKLYLKGSAFERELKQLFEKKGFATVRSAGSHGVDLIVGKKGLIYAFECKYTTKEKMYISKGDVDRLIKFSEIFGAEPYIALKINSEIHFINPYLLTPTYSGKNYLLDYKKVVLISKDFLELTGEGKQTRLYI